MNRKSKVIVSIVGITIVLLALLGITYAYYLTRIEGNTNTNSISITTADLKLVYSENSPEIITENNIVPGTTIGEKTFTVSNTGNTLVEDYKVVLEYAVLEGIVPSVFVRPQDFEITLTCVSKNIETNEVSGTCSGYTGTWNNESFEMTTNDINAGIKHEYSLTIFYANPDIDQSDDMGKNLNLKVQIYGSTDTSTLNGTITGVESGYTMKLHSNPKTSVLIPTANSGEYKYKFIGVEPGEHTLYVLNKEGEEVSNETITINKGTNTSVSGNTITVKDNQSNVYITSTNSGSTLSSTATFNPYSNNTNYLAYHIINNAINNTSGTEYRDIPLTMPSEQVSVENESILSFAMDDYGVSYYYRGNVQDNYINFADMCWRIVRIAGDGSIKLILEDKNSKCHLGYTGDWKISTTNYKGNYGFTTYNANSLTASDGTTNPITIKTMDYLHGQTNSASSMATAFKKFEIELFEVESPFYLKNGGWCLSEVAYSKKSGYPLLNSLELYDYKVKGTPRIYDSFLRLIEQHQPMLKCNGIIMDNWDDDETNPTSMYVGAITADEIVYAGSCVNKSSSFYLLNEYQKRNSMVFWTLSPRDYTNGSDSIFILNSSGSLGSSIMSNNTSVYFRPVINLRSGVEILKGDGTKKNPYVLR